VARTHRSLTSPLTYLSQQYLAKSRQALAAQEQGRGAAHEAGATGHGHRTGAYFHSVAGAAADGGSVIAVYSGTAPIATAIGKSALLLGSNLLSERVPDARCAPPLPVPEMQRRCFYGNRNREVVQRRQGVWLHHS